MALANFSRLSTMLLDVLSTAVAMLFANSAPRTAGGFAVGTDVLMGGVYVGCG